MTAEDDQPSFLERWDRLMAEAEESMRIVQAVMLLEREPWLDQRRRDP